MPRKSAVIENVESPLKVLTKEDIVEQFSIVEYTKLAKQCNLFELKDAKQHYSIWLKDNRGDIHLLIKDKSSKTCTYLGCLDGVKFDVVLDNSFFDTVKNYFKEGKNENNNSSNKFSIANNSSISIGEKVTT
jgi:hypothetical protein